MNFLTNISQSRASWKNERFLEISITIRTLQIYSDEIEGFPDFFGKKVHVQSLLGGYRDKISPDLCFRSRKILLVQMIHLVENNYRRTRSQVASYDIINLPVSDM